jgi:hypothetical protein
MQDKLADDRSPENARRGGLLGATANSEGWTMKATMPEMRQELDEKRFNRAIEKTRLFLKLVDASLRSEGSARTAVGAYSLWGPRNDDGTHTTLVLDSKEAEAYFECAKGLHDSLKHREWLDPDSVETLLREAVFAALLPTLSAHSPLSVGKRISSGLTDLRQALLRAPSTWELYYPVEGLNVEGKPVIVGRVEFAPPTRWRRKLKSSVAKVHRNSSNPDEALNKGASQGLEEIGSSRALARLHIKGTSIRAVRWQALKEIRSTLDAINFFADILSPRGLKARAYLPSEARPTVGFSPAFRLAGPNDQPVGAWYSHYAAGPLTEMTLSRTSLKKLEGFGFRKIAAILKKPEGQRTELERKILSAFEWAGRATARDLADALYEDFRREEAFLLYMLSLESLLLSRDTTKDGSRITFHLPRRTALLIQRTSPESDVERGVARLYDLRSRVVHRGYTEILDSDLYTARFFAKQALVEVLTRASFRNMKSIDSFEEWFKKRIPSAKREPHENRQ